MFKGIITLIRRNKDVIKYGVITNTTIGVLLRGIGDVIQQNIELKNNNKKEKTVLVYSVNEPRASNEPRTEKNNSDTKQKFDWTRTSKNSKVRIII